MFDIRVIQKDNVWAVVHCEDNISMELYEFLSFDSPGANFSEKYKKGHWDGKIHLFSNKTNKVYAGLIGYIKSFAKMKDYSCEVVLLQEEERAEFKGLQSDMETFQKYLESLQLPMTLYPYQKAYFLYAIHKKRAVLLSPTASGKSLIIYTMIRWLLDKEKKKQGLLIVPTQSLVEQMFKDFKSYGWGVDENCQKVYFDSGEDKIPAKPLIISTWQSIYNMPKKYFSQFDFVIGDEAHGFKANSLKDIMTGLVNCDYRIGTTGTLNGSKVHKLVLEGLFGPTKNFISTKDLMEKKILADLEINCLILKYPEKICNELKGVDYTTELNFICGSEERSNMIKNLVSNLEGNTLILYNYVEKHGELLFKLIKESLLDRKVYFISGGVNVKEREKVRKLVEEDTKAIIVASYGTYSTGINIRNLHNLILSSPTKSKVRTLQSIGRSLRTTTEKTTATLYDIVDDMRYQDYTNHSLNHYIERMKFYREEQFKVKITNIQIGEIK